MDGEELGNLINKIMSIVNKAQFTNGVSSLGPNGPKIYSYTTTSTSNGNPNKYTKVNKNSDSDSDDSGFSDSDDDPSTYTHYSSSGNQNMDKTFNDAFANFGKIFGTQVPTSGSGNVRTFVNNKEVNKPYANTTTKPKSDEKPKKTKPVKKTNDSNNQTTDMTEAEFDEAMKKFLESHTNPQLRSICNKLLMSRSTYKNKSEYVKIITEYAKSKTDEQLEKICQQHNMDITLPKYKQIMLLLETNEE